MIKTVSEIVEKYKEKLLEHLKFVESIKSYYKIQCFKDKDIYYWGQKLGIGNSDWEKITCQRQELSGISKVLELTLAEIEQYYDEAEAFIVAERQGK